MAKAFAFASSTSPSGRGAYTRSISAASASACCFSAGSASFDAYSRTLAASDSVRGAVNLHPQPLEGGIAIGDRGRHVPHLLRRGGIGAVRQKPDASPQGRVAIADPLFPRRHCREQVARRLALVLFLDRPAVELRVAQDPAAVGRDQELLDEELRIRIRESRVRDGLARVDAREHVGDLVALRAQLLRAVAPFAVLPALALLRARVILRRKHPAVLAEPLDRGERTTRVLLHLRDPFPVLAGGVGFRLAAGRGERGAGEPDCEERAGDGCQVD